MMNPFKGMNKEEILAEAQRYKHLCECFQKIDKSKNKTIRDLEAQLVARNQAAEAMGVLERLVEDINRITLDGPMFSDVYSIERSNGHSDGEIGEGNSLIEAVLKAGGEEQ